RECSDDGRLLKRTGVSTARDRSPMRPSELKSALRSCEQKNGNNQPLFSERAADQSVHLSPVSSRLLHALRETKDLNVSFSAPVSPASMKPGSNQVYICNSNYRTEQLSQPLCTIPLYAQIRSVASRVLSSRLQHWTTVR